MTVTGYFDEVLRAFDAIARLAATTPPDHAVEGLTAIWLITRDVAAAKAAAKAHAAVDLNELHARVVQLEAWVLYRMKIEDATLAKQFADACATA